MSKKCPKCGKQSFTPFIMGPTVYMDMYKCNVCGAECTVTQLENITLFDHVTESPEVLAEVLVYMSYIKKKLPLTDIRGRIIGYKSVLRQVWKSSVTEETYSKKAEAIAATVEKLKGIEK